MTRLQDGLRWPDHMTLRVQQMERNKRLAALRNLAGDDGADLDVAVALGLTDEDGASLVGAVRNKEISQDRAVAIIDLAETMGVDWRPHWRRHQHPAATPRDPAGCAACGRASGRGCAVCRQAWEGFV